MQVLTDPRDAALFSATPMLMAPRFGRLEPLPVGSRRLVAASNGVYLQARSQALDLCLRVASLVMPYGPMSQWLRPACGPIPRARLTPLLQLAQASPDREIAALLTLSANAPDGVGLQRPETLTASGSHITYRDAVEDDLLLLDCHSHGQHPAFWSSQDDESDLSRPGPYISAVIGECSNRLPSMAFRASVSPYLIDLDFDQLVHLGFIAP